MKLGIISSFEAAHSLPEYKGKCGRVHGHTYKVEVVVEGPLKNHWVMDYFDLRKITEEVLSSLDHRYLNEIISYPTCENIAMYIKNGVAERLKEAKLISVRIWEGEDQWVEG